ncbi:MAG TPA: hypothetical protein DCZ95_11650 [Verrucomicrobia bacterium]|nr:MAG: hypothetical protein A2X46_01775 [Lentisphaerae bacterium GWF2_57_35]HBA84739.1 hypothetical protein [Verrucomicrobiota bacterium]
MNSIPILDAAAFMQRVAQSRRPYHDRYYSMYSSVLDGIVVDPVLMQVPIDDHMVHRGDAVFETFKCVEGRIYNLPAHLERLTGSARSIGLALPCSGETLRDRVLQTVRAGGKPEALVRLFVSRGPGSLGISPYECPEPGLYIVVYELKPPFMQQHPDGARIRASAIPARNAPFANIKSVNYLLNVLMKKEAVDAGVDFVVAFDTEGFMAEGPTENMGIVSPAGVLKIPKPGHILAGTTMLRCIELARPLVADGTLTAVQEADITKQEAAEAAEILVFGTTPDVTAAVEYNGQPVGNGSPGRIYQALSQRLQDDIFHNPAMQTSVFA